MARGSWLLRFMRLLKVWGRRRQALVRMEGAELPVRARSLPSNHHRNAALTFEARLPLAQRCQHRPIAHVAAEMGINISQATVSPRLVGLG